VTLDEPQPTTAQVFARLRECLTDVIGSAATAAFLRRAVRKAAESHPELRMIEITKNHLDYQYVVPEKWTAGRDSLPVLIDVSRQLEALLSDLTGQVMIRHLRTVPLLLDAGLFRDGER